MKFKIKHEIRGRIRIHMEQKRMTHEQADILLFYLQNIDGVFRADVYDRTADATIHYKGNRETIIEGLRRFRYEEVEVPNGLLETSGRAMNAEYQEKLVDKIPLWKKILTAISDLGSIYNDHVGKIYLERHQDPDGKKD